MEKNKKKPSKKKLIKNLKLFLADKDRRISELQEDIRILVEGGEEAAKVKFKWNMRYIEWEHWLELSNQTEILE